MGNFIADFRVAEVCPLYKNDEKADKSNYRPISILSNVLKIYEDAFIANYTITTIRIFLQNTNVAFVKALVLGMPF